MKTSINLVKSEFESQAILLVDVRELSEWRQGHVTGACFLPLSELLAGNLTLDAPKDMPIYLYCASGQRVKKAQELLAPIFSSVVALEFGFESLKNCGFPCSSV